MRKQHSGTKNGIASLLLVVRPGAPSGFLFLVHLQTGVHLGWRPLLDIVWRMLEAIASNYSLALRVCNVTYVLELEYT